MYNNIRVKPDKALGLVGMHVPRKSKNVLPFLTYQNYFLRIFIFIDFFKKNTYTISVKKKSYQIDDCSESLFTYFRKK